MEAFWTKFGAGKLVALVAISVAGVNVTDARADHGVVVAHQMTASLNRATQHLAEEIHFELRGSPAFPHLQQDAAELVEATQHLQTVAVEGASLAHMREDLATVHSAQQHLAQVLQQTVSTAAVDRAMNRVDRLTAQLSQHWNLAASVPPPCTIPQPVVQPQPVVPAFRFGATPPRALPLQPQGVGYPQGFRAPRGVTVQIGNVRLGYVDRGR